MSGQGTIIIYLAGPIDDIDREEAREWREQVGDQFGSGTLLYSPAHAFVNAHYINARAIEFVNRLVLQNCDGVLANLSGSGRAFGTIREIEFARLHGKPVAVVADVSMNVHFSTFDLMLAPSFDKACDLLLKAIGEVRERPHPLALLLQPPQLGEDET